MRPLSHLFLTLAREVSSLASWLYCLLAYMALRWPDKGTRDRLVYACLIIREAQCHGGQGWLAYDRVFRQHAALDPSIQWNVLHPAIQVSTLFRQASTVSQSPTTWWFILFHLSGSGSHGWLMCCGIFATAILHSQHSTSLSRQKTTNISFPHFVYLVESGKMPHSKLLLLQACMFQLLSAAPSCFQQHPAVECPSKWNCDTPRPPTLGAGPSYSLDFDC